MAEYSNPGPEESNPAGEQPSTESEGTEGKTMMLEPGMLPEGMEAKPGDILEFKVVGHGADGGVEITYNTGEEGEGEGSTWAGGLRNEMMKE